LSREKKEGHTLYFFMNTSLSSSDSGSVSEREEMEMSDNICLRNWVLISTSGDVGWAFDEATATGWLTQPPGGEAGVGLRLVSLCEGPVVGVTSGWPTEGLGSRMLTRERACGNVDARRYTTGKGENANQTGSNVNTSHWRRRQGARRRRGRS
jgi:hypothetical protein